MHILVMYWRLIKGLFNKSKHLFLEIGSKCKRMPMCHSGAKCLVAALTQNLAPNGTLAVIQDSHCYKY